MIDIPDGVLDRARRGDVDAFRVILEVFQEPVHQTVWRLVGGRFPQEIEDVTQEVFVKIFRSIDRFDGTRGVKFSTWVYTFVKNQCFDVLKRRRLATTRLAGGADDDGRDLPVAARAAGPGEELLTGELGARIAASVATLPDDQRLAFVLREYQGLDYREIATIAECSEGTVKSRLYRAKEALRAMLRSYVLQ
jgi:RNA polymerase sigma-70 factor (ECF subfamily)